MGNDTELLEAWRSGNQRAGEILLSRYFESLNRFFASKLQEHTESLIQRTLLACVEDDYQLPQTASFRGYLFTVARHELYAHLRGFSRERPHHRVTPRDLRDLTDATSTLRVDRQEQKLMLKGLRQLSMDQQIVLGLFYWERLAIAELASVLEVPAEAIETHLSQARDELVTQTRALASSAELRRSTVDDLDAWLTSLAQPA